MASKSPKKSSSKASASALLSILYNDEFTATVEGHPVRKYLLWAVFATTAFFAVGSAFIVFQARPETAETSAVQLPFFGAVEGVHVKWASSLLPSETQFIENFAAFAAISVLLLIVDAAFVSNKIGIVPAVGTLAAVTLYLAVLYKAFANDPKFDQFADLYDAETTSVEWIAKVSIAVAVQSIVASLISIPDVSDDHAVVQKFGYVLCICSFLVSFYDLFNTIGTNPSPDVAIRTAKLFWTVLALQIGVFVSLPSLNAINNLE